MSAWTSTALRQAIRATCDCSRCILTVRGFSLHPSPENRPARAGLDAPLERLPRSGFRPDSRPGSYHTLDNTRRASVLSSFHVKHPLSACGLGVASRAAEAGVESLALASRCPRRRSDGRLISTAQCRPLMPILLVAVSNSSSVRSMTDVPGRAQTWDASVRGLLCPSPSPPDCFLAADPLRCLCASTPATNVLIAAGEPDGTLSGG